MHIILKVFVMTLMVLSISSMAEKQSTSNSLTVKEQGNIVTNNIGISYTIQSSVLAEKRELLVHLPEGYGDSERNYPVIYVLDGEEHFKDVVSVVDSLQHKYSALIPESIVVAIANTPSSRNRDFGAKQDNFIRFIKEEVTTFTERKYRTSANKSLLGHSYGGFFVLSVLAKSPELFDQYIAASPMTGSLLEKYKTLLLSDKLTNKSLHFTLGGEKAESKNRTENFKKLVALLQTKAPKNFNWSHRFMVDQIHNSTFFSTYYEGLAKVFSDYHAPLFSGYDDFVNQGGLAGLTAKYKERAEKYHIDPIIPEAMFNYLWMTFFVDNHLNEATKMLEQSVKLHAQSANAYGVLGMGYERNKAIEKAIQAYEKAYALAKAQSSPDVEKYNDQLDRLQKIMAL